MRVGMRGIRPQGVSARQSRKAFAFLALLALAVAAPGSALAKYASIVIDAETGQVLHAAGADTRNFPASLTKMMTLYMAFDAIEKGKLKLDQRIPVSAHAAGQAPSKLGLRPGSTVRLEDCILGMAVKSANDCAAAVGEAIGGTEANFARMMTERARQLGMTRTTFRNASGLPNAGQLSTARDMARLSQALIYDHAKYYHYFGERSFNFSGVTVAGHNRLMYRYPGMDGLKTGFIRASGFNLASSAVRDGRRLIGVVFGGQTAGWRDNHMAGLLDEAFAGRGTPVLVASADRGRGSKPPQRNRPVEREEEDVAPKVVAAAAKAAGSIASGAGELVLPRTAVAAPMAAAPKGRPSGWGIQVGAFNDRAAGQRAVSAATQRAGSLLDKAIPHVLEVSTAKGPIFRARLMGMDEKTARQACARLAKTGQGCLTVPPQAGL